ncbi:transcription factor bHLH153 isoform X1 [Gossypium hirsutum]|uniref:Transcription factor bHLH153 isoform X1 n=2 Tax=Gossypium hirsutum TaxID=3635 RepID=A0A1U8J8P2_GOSHI|nr:transcription factor bHLH153-like isoform X1 [Gossypium hirsutum]
MQMQALCSCEEAIDIGTMMENKRNPFSVDHTGFTSLASKRQKATKEKKDQVSERIAALQQLVSPYGKCLLRLLMELSVCHSCEVMFGSLQTDTASVLLEAMGYIRFLHEQVKVLSAPYLQTIPANSLQDDDQYSLRNRGLCLAPVSCTVGLARSNGADIWAPVKTTSPKFDEVISQFN